MISSNTLGRYQIIREIARSNDVVYEARDPVMGRRVAVKELAVPANLQGAARRERIERFYREAKAAGSLTHPNIVTIYEVGEDNGRQPGAADRPTAGGHREGRRRCQTLMMSLRAKFMVARSSADIWPRWLRR